MRMQGMPMPPAAWARIGKAVEFYQSRGYVYMDTPWLVEQMEYWATKPAGVADLYMPAWDKYLVASAEQGFLSLLRSGACIENAVSVSPCFRDEPQSDPRTHSPWFMKVELISTTKAVDEVLHDAKDFMREYATVDIVPTSAGDCDLEIGGIEVGSYGRRRYREFEWVYGTGLAEPRFSYACERQPACSWDYEATVREVIAAWPAQVHNYVIGKTAFGFLLGQCIKASKGRANPVCMQDELRRQLDVLCDAAYAFDHEALVKKVRTQHFSESHEYVVGQESFECLFKQAMKESMGRANPQVLEAELRRQLGMLHEAFKKLPTHP